MIHEPLRRIGEECITWKESVITACKRIRLSRLDFARTPPILVYQMGKVGSMSVFTSVKQLRPRCPVFHVHFLQPENLVKATQFYSDNRVPRPPEHIGISRTLIRKISCTKDIQWRIITLVRDPIERDISAFFQHVEWRSPHLRYRHGKIVKYHAREFVEVLTARFQQFDEATDFACTWFDRELKQVFGVDVYEHLFDHKHGFCVIRSATAEVLVLRLSDLDRVFQPAVTAFLHLREPISLVRANEAKDRAISDVYQEVLRMLVVDRSACERIYATKFARHFFNEQMRETAIARWTGSGRAVGEHVSGRELCQWPRPIPPP